MPSVDDVVEEFRHRRRARPTVVRTTDVVQAVAVAESLRAAGDADWFRGQVANWPKLAPTYNRLGEKDRQTAFDRMKRFSSWANSRPGLGELRDHDQLIAVAQHYGIATPFLDFTAEPRIAGFFATDGGPPPEGMDSCIICLGLNEARSIWDSLPEELQPAPALIEIDVSNLWRLEAQHGSFVWCPHDTLDGPYVLDRLVFPYAGPFDVPSGVIYPERASPLERLLSQYFQEEQVRDGCRFLHPSLSTSGETLTIEESMNFESENGRTPGCWR